MQTPFFQNLNEAKIIAHILNLDINKVLFENFEIDPKQTRLIDTALTKFRSGFPLDYILGRVTFLNREFIVDERVLIPRPETEWWVGKVLQRFSLNQNYKDRILVDVGTGSGVIALSLAEEFKHVWALDADLQALEICKLNLGQLKLKNVTILHSNLLQSWQPKNGDKNWILTANLPYVPISDKFKPPEIGSGIDFEPEVAIFSGRDGLDLFRKLILELKQSFGDNLPAQIFFELDPRNIQAAKEFAGTTFGSLSNFPNYDFEIWPDENELERILVLSN